ncbi:MAG: VWA domain-containing protein [Planctomycetaceae bacterium]
MTANSPHPRMSPFASQVLFIAVLAVAAFATPRMIFADGATATETGIQLVGRNQKDTPPYEWTVASATTKKTVASRSKKWGMVAISPGKYTVSVKWRYYSMPVEWARVTVETGKVVTLRVRSGIVLSGRTDKAPVPYEWYVYDAETNKKVGHAHQRRGFMPLPPGKYRLAVKQRYYSLPINWSDVTVKKATIQAVKLASGIRLAGRSDKDTAPYAWSVYDAGTNKKVGYAYKRWGFMPLPPGKYNIDVKFGGVPLRGPVTIESGKVRSISLEDLGARQITVELPAAKNVRLASGNHQFAAEVVQGKKTVSLTLKTGRTTKSVSTLIPLTGDVIVRIRSGAMTLEMPVTLQKGRNNVVPFDAESLAAQNNLSLFEVDFGNDGNKSRERRLVVMDSTGKQLLLLDDKSASGVRYLSPPKPRLRLRVGNVEVVRTNIPVGHLANVAFQPPKVGKESGKPKIHVDIVIESPKNGTIVRGKRVKLIGRASTTGPAGATRVAIILDVSGSARNSSGADIDGDGKHDSILKAEIAAARLLIGEIKSVENKGPGTAFAVTILRFSSRGEVIAPLTAMTQPGAVKRLNAALDRIAKDGTLGNTNFESAIDTALTAFRDAKRSGPSVILFMTDGAPTRGSRGPVLSSLDAAARAGLSGTVIHTIGLGKAFLGKISPNVGFPPRPRTVVNVLATMKDAGAPGGTVTPLPKPADVVKVVSRLPVLELPDAKLKEVQVTNTTIKRPAFAVKLEKDGSFAADVPVSLLPMGSLRWNTLQSTAIAMDGVSRATAKVRVRGAALKATLHVVTKDGKVPSALLPALQIVYDSSGSMKEKIGKTSKRAIARSQTKLLLSRLPANRQVGLRMFGHRGVWILRKSNPNAPAVAWKDPRLKTDTELVVPIRALTRSHRTWIRKWLDWATPEGKTPLVLSLLKAKNDFPRNSTAQRTIVLISDGVDTCGGNLDDVRKAYRGAKINAVIHVVGFDVKGTPAERQLQEIARIGGGKYYSAGNAGELIASLTSAVDSTGYTVLDRSGKRIVARGFLNGSRLQLKPGRYVVRLNGGANRPVTVDLNDGQNLKLTVAQDGNLTVAQPR